MSNTKGGPVPEAAIRNDVLYIAGTILGRSPGSLAIDVPLTDRRIGASDVVAGDIALAVEDWFDVGLDDDDEPATSIQSLTRGVARALSLDERQPPSGAEREEVKARFDAACRRAASPDDEVIRGFGKPSRG